MNDIVLKTKNLTKQYNKQIAVNNVNIEIKKGDIYGLVGKNGAGKTTLLRMVSGLTIPTNGELEMFHETSLEGLNKARKRTGCIIETPSFFPYLSARKNLEYYRIQKGIVEKNAVDEVLEAVELQDTGNKKFKNFSLGMKQRLGLAYTMLGNPDLLLLDEPINGLDPFGIVKYREILKKLNRERNITIIISSHVLGELSQLASTYGFFHEGKLIEQISSHKIEEKCQQSLSIKVDDIKKAVVVLENKLITNNYRVLTNNEIRLFDYVNTPEKVAQEFITNGVMVSSINQTGINLENYFIDLIGGNKND